MGRILPFLILIAAAAAAYWYFAMREAPDVETEIEEVVVIEEVTAETDGPRTIEEATAGDSNVALWVTGDEDTTVYLMGTIHILNPGLAWENDAFEAAWTESGTVYFEADVMSQEAAEAAAPIVMSEAFYTDGTVFADLFTDEEIELLDSTLGDFGLSVAAVGNMRPWFVSVQVAQLAIGQAGGVPEAGIEMLLGARAAEEDKSMRYFETMGEQIKIIASIPDDVWATSLIEGIEDLSEVEAYFAQMVGLWYHGDADGLAAFLSEAWEETPDLKTTLLDERNEKWAVVLDTLIEEEAGTFFVAVGAGHLAGEGSVQDYLADHGHETTRVNP